MRYIGGIIVCAGIISLLWLALQAAAPERLEAPEGCRRMPENVVIECSPKPEHRPSKCAKYYMLDRTLWRNCMHVETK